MTTNLFQEIIEGLTAIEKDSSVPKNVRLKVKTAIDIILDDSEKNVSIKIDKSLQELGDVAEEPNLPQYTRMQIWSVLSQLESK